MTSRAEIVAEARSWLHTPFVHQAACKGAGVDCIGILRGVATNLKIEGYEDFSRAMLQEFAGYGRDPNPELLELACERYLDRIELKEVRRADILRFRMPMSMGMPKHFGIVTEVDPLYMMHSWAGGKARAVENRVDDIWMRRINACYRFRGIE